MAKYRAFSGERPAPRMAGLPLVGAALLILAVIGIGVYMYSFQAPSLDTTSVLESPQSMSLHNSSSYRQPHFTSAFAVQVRNQVLGGPYAVPERHSSG